MNILKVLLVFGILFATVIYLFVQYDLTIFSSTDIQLHGLNKKTIYLGEGDTCKTLNFDVECKPGLKCVSDEYYGDNRLGTCQRLDQMPVSHSIIQN